MENGPFMDDFPTKTSIDKGFPMAMLNNQRVYKNDSKQRLTVYDDPNIRYSSFRICVSLDDANIRIFLAYIMRFKVASLSLWLFRKTD